MFDTLQRCECYRLKNRFDQYQRLQHEPKDCITSIGLCGPVTCLLDLGRHRRELKPSLLLRLLLR